MQYQVLLQLILLIGLSSLFKSHQKQSEGNYYQKKTKIQQSQQLLEQALNEVFGNSSFETQRKILKA